MMRGPGSPFTLFFATDLHGSDICYRKFVAAADFYQVDLLLLGGDFTGKALVPIVEWSDGSYRSELHGKAQRLTLPELDGFESRLANLGLYPSRMSSDELEHYRSDENDLGRLFERLISERVIDWIGYARRKLSGSGTIIGTAPANDDPWSIDQVIAEHGEGVFVNLEGSILEVAPGLELLTSGYTNPTPWATPREFPEEEILDYLEKVITGLARPESAIFNLHPPPYGSKIDLAPKLDENLSIETSLGAQKMVPVGSKAVRQVIEEHQPLASLHGHIHESPGVVRLGRTLCLNPGSEYGEGILKGVLLRVGEGRVLSHQATSG